jgi:hypothetical protein
MNLSNLSARIKTTILLLSVVFFFASASEISAQKRFSKSYPASKNVNLKLINRTGTITVEGWNKEEVKILADMETASTKIIPQNLSGTIYINLVKDNQGRDDVGYVNFLIKVPYQSSINIETMIGNLTVNNVGGALVRAHISSEGDITLTNIGAANVSAENVIGDIFYDGEIQSGGIYRFTSTRGNINLRIPSSSSFRLVATAPSTRNISLGIFSNANLNFGDGRRVYGNVGDGNASLTVTNQRGSISFLKR